MGGGPPVGRTFSRYIKKVVRNGNSDSAAKSLEKV